MLARLMSRIYSRVSRRAPADLQTLELCLQRGFRAQCDGDEAGAEQFYRQALAVDGASADAHLLLGKLLGKRGQYAPAIAHLRQAADANPELADAHLALGNIYLLQENRPAALARYERALQIVPDSSAVHSNLGVACHADGRREDALRHFKRAYELAPEAPGALKNLIQPWFELGQFNPALTLLEGLYSQRPDDFEALKYLGMALQKLHRPQDALHFFLQGRAMKTTDAELHAELGVALRDLGRLDAAMESFADALAVQPEHVLARWHRALVFLLRCDFAHGWRDYDLRLISADVPRRLLPYPAWDGTPLAGRSVLIYGEQGLGDEILFASCLPEMIASSGRCMIECRAKLEPLFRRSFPGATVYASAPDGRAPDAVRGTGVDVQIAIGSIPRFLRGGVGDFPPHAGYLRADPARVAHWREQLEKLGSGVKIGIAWRGGSELSRGPVRSIPLALWEPILRVPGAHFIDLQYSDCSTEINAFEGRSGVRIHRWQAVRDDYEDTAAMVSALDLIISVDTAIVQLGGALGKPVWVMVLFSPEWRYGISGETMPWYPSVRIFRQPAYGEWRPVIDAVAHSLLEFSPLVGRFENKC